jgi:hypothetical protein
MQCHFSGSPKNLNQGEHATQLIDRPKLTPLTDEEVEILKAAKQLYETAERAASAR